MAFGWNSGMSRRWKMNLNGFPADKKLDTMWHSYGPITAVQAKLFYHKLDTYYKNSGSAVYRYLPQRKPSRIVYGVHRGFTSVSTHVTSHLQWGGGARGWSIMIVTAWGGTKGELGCLEADDSYRTWLQTLRLELPRHGLKFYVRLWGTSSARHEGGYCALDWVYCWCGDVSLLRVKIGEISFFFSFYTFLWEGLGLPHWQFIDGALRYCCWQDSVWIGTTEGGIRYILGYYYRNSILS